MVYGKMVLNGWKRECTMKKSLSSKYPLLSREWSIKNLPLTPEDVTAGSNKRVWWKGTCGHEWQASIKNRGNGAGCPYCTGHKLLKGFNDLASMKPELVSEWSDRNDPLKADMVISCTNKEVWWKCIRGHEWMARVADRFYGSQCPYCTGHRIYSGFNDLAALYPELSSEWSERNSPKKADQVSPRSVENVWWKCRVCGYEWRAVIVARVKGGCCPVCSDRMVKEGFNDLQTTDPWILPEWDFDRNTIVKPTMVSRNSLRFVWWKCPHGHRWRAKIAYRTLDKEPCHICRKDFEKVFPDLLLRLYIRNAGYEVIIDEEDLIGVPLSNYIREKNAVIEISKPEYNRKDGYKWEYAKTALCRKSRIKLIRILKQRDREFEDCVNITRLDNSDEALSEALKSALQLLRIKADGESDVSAEKESLFREFMERP